jgi:hypothetical protein
MRRLARRQAGGRGEGCQSSRQNSVNSWLSGADYGRNVASFLTDHVPISPKLLHHQGSMVR